MDSQFFVAWWNSPTWGDISDVFNKRESAENWIAEQKLHEHITYFEIVEFDNKKRAEEYRSHGA